MMLQSRYFPVDGPLEMKPGLFKLGHDFGNGEADKLFFQRDIKYWKYIRAKSKEYGHWSTCPRFRTRTIAMHEGHKEAHKTIENWLCQGDKDKLNEGFTPYDAIFSLEQEDGVVIYREEDGSSKVIMSHVCFPSGWRSEEIIGKSFQQLHGAVPPIKNENRMLSAMIDRGPFVRFMWTISPDEELDHHPDHYQANWKDCKKLFLRVERQTTVPFSEVNAALFLIRTYLYSVPSLGRKKREVLKTAISQTNDHILSYKGLLEHKEFILERI